MSGGFFRGTSAEQDTRFSNKQAKLLKSQKFPPELEHLVDISKVKMDVINPWIARRVTELIGFEDEVLINFIYELLDGKEVNGKGIQIQLTGFMEKNTGKFMKELWALLLSAQKNASGVPQQFLDAKEEETMKKKAETDRIFNEIQRRRDNETIESEHERTRKMDGGLDKNYAKESNRRTERGSDPHSGDENGAEVTNGFEGRKRSSKSPYSSDHLPSPRRGARSRSISKSLSRSNSKERSISRSISGSPRARRRSLSPNRLRSSPGKRSITPKQRSARESISPMHRSHPGRRSSSRTQQHHRSPSIVRRRVQSPVRSRRSPSPLRRRSPFYARRRSPSPRRKSRSPLRRHSPVARRRRSPSPRHQRPHSPWRRRLSSPRRQRSPSPRHRRQRSTSSSRSRSPFQRRPASPARRRYQSPIRRRSPIQDRRRSPSPGRRPLAPWARKSSQSPGRSRSPVPVRRRSPVPVRRRSPAPAPSRRRSPAAAHRRSPASSPSLSRSPASGISSSPIGRRLVSPVKMKSPRLQKSPQGSPTGRTRTHDPARMDRKQLISLSPQRDHADRNRARRKVPSVSPSPEKSPCYSDSPQTRTKTRMASPDQSPYKRAVDQKTHDDCRNPAKLKDHKAHNGSPVRSDEVLRNSREGGENKSIEKGSGMLSGGKNKESPDRSLSRRRHDGSDLRKDNEIKSNEAYSKEVRASKKSPRKGSLPAETPDVPRTVIVSKSDEKSSSFIKHTKDNMKSDSLLDSRKRIEQRSPSVDSDSGAEGSEKQIAGAVEKRKHRKSGRQEVESDYTSSDSETEGRKEVKRKRKEEKKLRKEEKRRRREERRRRKEEKRSSKRKRKSKDGDLSSSDTEVNEKRAYASIGERGSMKYSTDDLDTESQKKRLEIELREKALESLRAKKGIGR